MYIYYTSLDKHQHELFFAVWWLLHEWKVYYSTEKRFCNIYYIHNQESIFALNHKIKLYYTVSIPPLSFSTLKTLEIIHSKASSRTHHTYQISFGISERCTTSALPPGVVNSHLSFQFSFIFFFF